MNLLFRAIVMGFGMAAGAALYKRVAEQVGLEKKPDAARAPADATPTPPVDPAAQRAL
jgi:hypothetical protein